MKRTIPLTLMGLLLLGCTPQPTPKVKIVEKREEVPAVAPLVTAEGNEGLAEQLKKLSEEKTVAQIVVESEKKEYSVGEAISFSIDTKEASGYLYLIAIDEQDVTFLQPNPYSVLGELQGKHQFPEDFTKDKFDVGAIKHCQGCESETTILYALLTKEAINDIKNISGNQLLSFVKNSTQAKVFSKGMMIRMNEGNEKSEFAIGKLEIKVK